MGLWTLTYAPGVFYKEQRDRDDMDSGQASNMYQRVRVPHMAPV